MQVDTCRRSPFGSNAADPESEPQIVSRAATFLNAELHQLAAQQEGVRGMPTLLFGSARDERTPLLTQSSCTNPDFARHRFLRPRRPLIICGTHIVVDEMHDISYDDR